MVGGPIIGHYHGVRAGHGMTNRLLRALFADAANYEWVEQRQPSSRQPILTAVPNTPPVRPDLGLKLAASA
jgi:UDP-3-O-acyl-N-acetylglucosamine deacetylase